MGIFKNCFVHLQMDFTCRQNTAEFIINSISLFQFLIDVSAETTDSNKREWKEIYQSTFSEFLQRYLPRITVIYYKKSCLMFSQPATQSGPLSVSLQGKNQKYLSCPKITMSSHMMPRGVLCPASHTCLWIMRACGSFYR